MIAIKEAASPKAALRKSNTKDFILSHYSLQVLHTKNKINFTQNVLEERIFYAYEWFYCCKNNLEQSEIGSKNFHRWKVTIIESMKGIFELEEMLFQNVTEKKVITQIYNEKRVVYA